MPIPTPGSSNQTSKFAAKDPILAGLNRAEGQLRGIIRMYQDEKSCTDIVRQVVAVRNSLSTLARDLLSSEASKCSKEKQVEQLNEILTELLKY